MDESPGLPLLVTGASGLIGSALAERRSIVPLRRGACGSDRSGPEPSLTTPEELSWEPLAGRVYDDGRPLAGVVHLAGENIAWISHYNSQVAVRFRDRQDQILLQVAE